MGTLGDVQPFVALGKALKRQNYNVTICTGENFRTFVEDNGVAFFPVRIDYLELTQSEEGKKMMRGNPVEIIRNMKTLIMPMMKRMLEDLWEGSKDADVLIYNPKAFGGYDIAEKLGIPVFMAHPIPIIAPTHIFTNPALPVSFNNGILNKMSFKLNRLLMVSFLKIINKWRKETLGLSNKRSIFTNDLVLNGKPIPILYGCSPTVIPYDENWKGNVSMAGFWFLEERKEWESSVELLRFLEDGAPPIAISFSSMPLKYPDRVKEMLTEALRKTGQRGIFISGWSGMHIEDVNSHILTIEFVPHAWLFPKTAGVIHHGGAGTTAAALKAGRPMIICPFSADQPFWAKYMLDIGVATAPLRERDMSIKAFSGRIETLKNEKKLRENAVNIGAKINLENGTEDTIKFIEENL